MVTRTGLNITFILTFPVLFLYSNSGFTSIFSQSMYFLHKLAQGAHLDFSRAMGHSDPSKSSGLRSQSDQFSPVLTKTLIYLLLYRLF
jgi:hypothetical protein